MTQDSQTKPQTLNPILQIAIHSSPRFSTWIWIPDWKVLIDAGDGVTQQLGYKIRKIDTVVCTHSHRDHIGGLLQVVNQRGEAGPFALGHPCGGNSFRQLEAFANKFNPGTSHQAIWRALEEGDEIPGDVGDRIIKCFRTRHYLDDHPDNPPRSLGFHLLWRKQKVKPELRGLSQKEMDAIRLTHGVEFLTEQVNEKWISIGGDGMPLNTPEVAGTKLLLHEATFLCAEDRDSLDDEETGATDGYGHVHSTVEEALRVAHEAEIENLILYHISTRYTDAEIKETIRAQAQKLNLRARVWATMPRRIYWNILGDKPLWE